MGPPTPAMTLPPDRGLAADGSIRREGSPDLVQAELAPLVERYVGAVRQAVPDGLDGVYLYGSIPRGTARVGVSDFDGQVVLNRQPTDADRQRLAQVDASLAAAHPEVDGVASLLLSRAALTDPAERFDGGFHLRVLCTPFWGDDAGQDVAPHRPDLDLARGIQGGWRAALRRMDDRVAERPEGAAARRLCRGAGRRLARIAFTWVLPTWGGWTSDPSVMRQVVVAIEPGWAAPMAQAVHLGWGDHGGHPDLAALHGLIEEWAPELASRGDALGA